MKMTYDGALVMPMGCAMMDDEEMTYVEGGDNVYSMTVKEALTYFKFVIGAAGAFTLGSTLIKYVGGIGSCYYELIGGSALTCYNQCVTWKKKYGSTKNTTVTEYTVTKLNIISGYGVELQ